MAKTVLAAAALLLSAVNAVQPPNGDYLISYHRRCCRGVPAPHFPLQPTGHVISDWASVLENMSPPSVGEELCVNFYGGGGRVEKKDENWWPTIEEGKDWTFQGMYSKYPGLRGRTTTCVSIEMMVPGSEPFTSEANFFTPDFLDELSTWRPTVKIGIGHATLDDDLIPVLETIFETESRVYDFDEVYMRDMTVASEEDVRAVVTAEYLPKELVRRLEDKFKLRVGDKARSLLFKHQLRGVLTWEEVFEGHFNGTKSQRRSTSRSNSKERQSSKEMKALLEARRSMMQTLNKCNRNLRKRFLSTAMRDEFPASSISAEDPQRITDYLLVNSFLPTIHADYSQELREANKRNAKYQVLSVCAQEVKVDEGFKYTTGFKLEAKPVAVATYSRRSIRDVQPEGNEDGECFVLGLAISDDHDPLRHTDVLIRMITAKIYRRHGILSTSIDYLTSVEFSKIIPTSWKRRCELSADCGLPMTVSGIMKKIARTVEKNGYYEATDDSSRSKGSKGSKGSKSITE